MIILKNLLQKMIKNIVKFIIKDIKNIKLGKIKKDLYYCLNQEWIQILEIIIIFGIKVC